MLETRLLGAVCTPEPLDPVQTVDCVKQNFVAVVKPVAWEVFGPLFREAAEAQSLCMSVRGLVPVLAGTSPLACQAAGVVLGLAYYGLLDPPERVAMKYITGWIDCTGPPCHGDLPQFCPSNGGATCRTDPSSPAIPESRGIHPLEHLGFFFQAQYWVEPDEETDFDTLCNGGGTYEDCVHDRRANMQYSPNGNEGVWLPLPGAHMTLVMQGDQAPDQFYRHKWKDQNVPIIERSTTLDGSQTYVTDGYGVPNLDDEENGTGDFIPLVRHVSEPEDQETVLKQLVLDPRGLARELDLDVASRVYLRGTIHHEAEPEETAEVTGEGAFVLNRWPIMVPLGGDLVLGEKSMSANGVWGAGLHFDLAADRNVTLDLDAEVLRDGSYRFSRWYGSTGAVYFDSSERNQTITLAAGYFNPSSVDAAFAVLREVGTPKPESVEFVLGIDGIRLSLTARDIGFYGCYW